MGYWILSAIIFWEYKLTHGVDRLHCPLSDHRRRCDALVLLHHQILQQKTTESLGRWEWSLFHDWINSRAGRKRRRCRGRVWWVYGQTGKWEKRFGEERSKVWDLNDGCQRPTGKICWRYLWKRSAQKEIRWRRGSCAQRTGNRQVTSLNEIF